MAEGFDISKYITAADIASAITAGVIAYIKNRPKIDDQQPTAEPSAAKPVSNADPTIRVDRGRIDIQDPKLWKDGGVVNMNGNEIHVFKAPDGSTIRVNPYQLQAAGGDPMKAAMNQFAAKVQNGQVDMDKLFSAGTTVTTTPKLSYGFDDRMSPEQMMLSTQNFENAVSNSVESLNLPKSVSARLTDALFKIRSQCGDNEILHQLLDDPAKLKILSANLPRSTFSLEGNVFINNLVKQLKGGADLVQASRMAHRAIGY